MVIELGVKIGVGVRVSGDRVRGEDWSWSVS